MHPPISYAIATASGLVPLSAAVAALPLPQGPDPAPGLTYGPYFEALGHFLTRDGLRPLREALSQMLGRHFEVESIERVEVISQKHGALYNVSQIRVHSPAGTVSLAANLASLPEQRAFLEEEFTLLERLFNQFALPYLPRPYLQGECAAIDASGRRVALSLFLAEWFEGYHEFHLSDAGPVLKVWDYDRGEHLLDAARAEALYSRAAFILTSYLDPESFEQIYPWHHAAGDFIVRPDPLDLRLITARGYRCLLPSEPDNPWLGLVHFFCNLTIRMRLDRFDGTGALAWAAPESLIGVTAGFLRAWSQKAEANGSLPPAPDLLHLMRGFSPEEWSGLAEIVLEDGMIEAEESTFIAPRLADHVEALTRVLQTASL